MKGKSACALVLLGASIIAIHAFMIKKVCDCGLLSKDCMFEDL